MRKRGFRIRRTQWVLCEKCKQRLHLAPGMAGVQDKSMECRWNAPVLHGLLLFSTCGSLFGSLFGIGTSSRAHLPRWPSTWCCLSLCLLTNFSFQGHQTSMQKNMDIFSDSLTCEALVQQVRSSARVLECGFGSSPAAVCYWSLQDKFSSLVEMRHFCTDLCLSAPMIADVGLCWAMVSISAGLAFDPRAAYQNAWMNRFLSTADIWETWSFADAKPQLMPDVLNGICAEWPSFGSTRLKKRGWPCCLNAKLPFCGWCLRNMEFYRCQAPTHATCFVNPPASHAEKLCMYCLTSAGP